LWFSFLSLSLHLLTPIIFAVLSESQPDPAGINNAGVSDNRAHRSAGVNNGVSINRAHR
jgi:hypothetical protein